MKKLWIGSIVLIIIVVAYFSLYLSSKPTKPIVNNFSRVNTFSNVTELYFLFTPYMEDVVNSRLQAVECQFSEYYNNNSQVCFVCGKFDACFGYVWVNRTDGKKMNPYGCTLIGNYDRKIEMDFYSYGISKLLNCKYNGDYSCEDGTEARLEHFGLFSVPVFIFPSYINMTEKTLQLIHKINETEECQFSGDVSIPDYIIECKLLSISIINNKVTVT